MKLKLNEIRSVISKYNSYFDIYGRNWKANLCVDSVILHVKFVCISPNTLFLNDYQALYNYGNYHEKASTAIKINCNQLRSW